MTTKALLGFTVVTFAALIAGVEGIADCAPDRKPSGPVEFTREPVIPPVHKDLRINVKNIAELLRSGHPAAARKLALAVAPQIEEVYDLMELHRPRSKKGLGWGPLPQPGAPVLDSLERNLTTFARAVPPHALNTPANNEEAALWIAAISHVTFALAPKRDVGPGKTRLAWMSWADQLGDVSMEFRKAAAANDPKAMQQSAAKVNMVCNNCHNVFRE